MEDLNKMAEKKSKSPHKKYTSTKDLRKKRKAAGKKSAKKWLTKDKPSWDKLDKVLERGVGKGSKNEIKGQPSGTTRRQYTRKRLEGDSPPAWTQGEGEALDEYFGPGSTKKILRTRREKAYDSMRGKKGGGSVGRGMGKALRGGGAVTRS